MRFRVLSSCCTSWFAATLALGAQIPANRPLVEPNIHILLPELPDAKMAGITISSRPFVPRGTLLEANTNLVQLSVVVRDASGQAEGGLGKSDFLLYKDGSPQPIQSFSAYEPQRAPAAAPTARVSPTSGPTPSAAFANGRTVALYFDDYSMTFNQLAMARVAATKFIESTPAAGLHLGVFSSSGAVETDFSSNAVDWERSLAKLSYQGRMTPDGGDNIMAMSPALADQISTVSTSNSPYLKQVASQYAAAGLCHEDACAELARANAQQTLERAVATATDTFVGLAAVVKALASQPQPRILLLVSSGFLSTHATDQQSALIERALRAGVVLDTLDARLLEPEPSGKTPAELMSWLNNRFTLDGVMESLADGTGGRFTHNNDMIGAMRNAVELAEPRYLLAFYPPGMRADGKFHKLKVRLSGGRSGDIEARDGYYDPEPDASASGHARPSVLNADVMNGRAVEQVPVTVSAGFSRNKAGRTSVRVVSSIFRTFMNPEAGQNIVFSL